jgi:putative ABC transport system permease protein
MKFLPLLWSNLKRKKLRTAFTLLSILIAFVLFAYLAAIRMAFRMGIDVAGVDRLVAIHSVSLIQPLPFAYKARIAQTPGVKAVTHASWFGGVYQNPNRGFQAIGQFPVEPEEYFQMYPELLLPAEQMQAWLADRQGVVVGRSTAKRYGWKLGDTVPIQAPWPQMNGSRTWEFHVVGIYDVSTKGADDTQFLFRYDYYDESKAVQKGNVGWYIIRVTDPAQSAVIAKAIDQEFANSAAETETSTEKAFMQGFAKQVGDIGAIITGILTAVFLTMLLVAGNTMAQSVRERTSELAVLKTLGFTGRQVMTMVLAESTALAVLGGGAGLLLGWRLVARGDPTGGALPIFFLPATAWALGIALMLALGLVTGALPAARALNLKIVDALRRA